MIGNARARAPRGDARAAALLALALGASALAHAPALRAGFVWDDRLLVAESPAVTELRPLGEYFARPFWSASSQGERAPYYRPVTVLSYALDHALWAGQPSGFHATNLLAHLGCVALVFALARRSGVTPLGAALAASAFGTAPRSGEAVDWISGRTDVLAALGALGALALHTSAPRALGRRVLAAACIGVGMLAKETALAGAAAIVALEALPQPDGPWRLRVANLLPLGAALAAYALLRAAAGREAVPLRPDALGERALFALQALGSYAWMLADCLRPNLQIGLLGALEPRLVALGALALAGAVVALTLAVARRAPCLPTAAGVMALSSLLPVLHLVPLPLRVVAADRFLYLALAGLAIAAAARIAACGLERRRALGAAACALVALSLPTSALRASLFAVERALWESAVAAAHPLNPQPHTLLGEALLRAGEPERALEELREAERRAAELRRQRPAAASDDRILGNVAGCLLALGRHDEAAAALEELRRRQPQVAKHAYNLAVVRARQGRLDQALVELDASLRLAPGQPRALELRRALERERAGRPVPAQPSALGSDSARSSFSRR